MKVRAISSSTVFAICLSGLLGLGGCRTVHVEKDYSRPLPPGASALRKLPPERWPDLLAALGGSVDGIDEASRRSLEWFNYPSSEQFFPIEGITHEQARLSVLAMRSIMLDRNMISTTRMWWVRKEFDLYQSIGCDDRGTVLFTGYYAPIIHASLTPTGTYRYPLYRQPPQLVKPDVPGEAAQWRQADGSLGPAPTRAQLKQSNVLQGNELVWLADPLDVYIVQVQGSARLQLPGRRFMDIGYAADNGHDYVSVAGELIKDGKLDKNGASLAAIRGYFRANPQDLATYLNRNPRFIFFQEYDKNVWPAGSLGFKVTSWRSLATDKKIFPRAMPMFVDTRVPDYVGGTRAFEQIMFDQDTGGAIRAPGRADIFMGIGPTAEAVAGRQKYEGQMYYFVLKPERMDYWRGILERQP